MAGTHSQFSPSKSSVWANCHGAIAFLEAAKLPEEAPNEHAASGTFTHSIAERMLNNPEFEPIGLTETHDGFTFKCDSAREERAITYVRAVQARGGLQFYEQKMATLPWPGTGDAVVARLEEHALEAHDLKDGNGKVIAKDNEQLICYLLLAWKEFEYLDDFQMFRGFIHQPKIGWYNYVEYTREEMLAWLTKLQTAYEKGKQALERTPNQVRAALTAGPWCEKGWCRMRGNCPARNNAVVATIPDTTVNRGQLSDDELGELLSRRFAIEAFFNDLHGEALNRSRLGNKVPGWKLATGKQGPRKWNKANLEKIEDTLYEKLQAETYERSVISPTTAESKLKKTHPETWATLQSDIERSEGTVTLVPDADPRPAVPSNAPEFGAVDDAADLL